MIDPFRERKGETGSGSGALDPYRFKGLISFFQVVHYILRPISQKVTFYLQFFGKKLFRGENLITFVRIILSPLTSVSGASTHTGR